MNDGGKRRAFATRLNSFRGGATAEDSGVLAALRAVSAVPGLTAVELNYPQHFAMEDEEAVAATLCEQNLTLTALNLRYEGRDYLNGAFTHPSAATRDQAIRLAKDAVDLAARLDGGHVILWLAYDGYDYPFQVDYARLWSDEIDGFRDVAAHNNAVRVSVEYKPVDPRRQALIRTMADALLAVREVDSPNFGVTLDFCHSLMAGEQPAAAAAMALRENRLFGVHLNDGYGQADDGLLVGSIHPWQTMELLLYLRRFDYDGVIYFDTFPVREDPAAECAANIARVRTFERALDNLDQGQLAEAQGRHDALTTQTLLQATLRDTYED